MTVLAKGRKKAGCQVKTSRGKIECPFAHVCIWRKSRAVLCKPIPVAPRMTKTSCCYCRQYVVQPHIAPYRTAVGDFVGQNLSESKFDPSERQKINKVIVYFFHYLYFTTSVDNLSMILRKNICNLLWRFCRQNN